ncbi:MAG TPA: hypothetical protein VFQ61_29800, partial [Polyangiaceae bacterium]|nr:hypothetical protein [Polyangiaceae bacterium]
LEQPICTLNRYINRPAPELPKHAVFLVLSDEDDISKPEQCLAQYSYHPSPSGVTDSECQTGCDWYDYSMQFQQALQTIEARCVEVDDQGVPHPESYSTIFGANSANICDPNEHACSADDIALLKNACGPDSILGECSAKCDGGAASIYSCTLRRPDLSLDLCNEAFTEGGTTYRNMADYCQRAQPDKSPWQECSVTGIKQGGRTLYDGQDVLTKVVEASSLSDMIESFHDRARSAFGATGYFVESVIFDPSFSCSLQSGQSYGATLRQLASSPADVFPICSDYAPALQRIQGFAQKLVQNEFKLELKSDEELESVTVHSLAGGTRMLAATEYSFDRSTAKLVLKPGTLAPSDSTLDLLIADTCVELVR